MFTEERIIFSVFLYILSRVQHVQKWLDALRFIVKYDPRKIFVQENDNLLRSFSRKNVSWKSCSFERKFFQLVKEKRFL